MYYLDTQVILAYSYKSEAQHERAVGLIKQLHGDFYTSPIGLLELYLTVSRRLSSFKLPVRQMDTKPPTVRVGIIVKYALDNLKIRCCTDASSLTKIDWLGIELSTRYHETIKIAPELQLPTGDSLHVSYAQDLKKEGKISYIVSLDYHFSAKKENIKKMTGIELIDGIENDVSQTT